MDYASTTLDKIKEEKKAEKKPADEVKRFDGMLEKQKEKRFDSMVKAQKDEKKGDKSQKRRVPYNKRGAYKKN